MRITSEFLRSKGACENQVKLFESLSGDSLELTEALCVEHANKFDWEWAARNLLSDAAWAEYERVCAPARAEYVRVRDAARAEYERVRDPAWAEYERVCAATFFKLWNKGE